MSYDEKCAELAKHFLDDATKERGPIYDSALTDLANDIADTVDNFLNVRLCEKCHTIMTAKQAIHAECPTCRGGQ